MDTAATCQVVDIINSLKWPVVALVIFFFVRKPLLARLKSLVLRTSGDGTMEMEIGLEPWANLEPKGIVVIEESDDDGDGPDDDGS